MSKTRNKKKKDKKDKKARKGKGKRKQQPVPTAVGSKWIEIRGSDIHGRGLFAIRKIPNETPIIEYVGDKVSKEESDRRGWALFDSAKGTNEAAVFIFTVNDDFDIDGAVEWNSAGLINHSCDPNCEALIEDDHIWITALRTIKKGEELSYNYGFDLENYKGHPCRCGTSRCVGYIVGEEHWPKLKKELKKKRAKKRAKKRTKK